MTWIPPEGRRVRSPIDPENACPIHNRITAAAQSETQIFGAKNMVAIVMFLWDDETATWGHAMTIMDVADKLGMKEQDVRNRIKDAPPGQWEGQIELGCRRWRWVNYRKKRRAEGHA